LGTKLPFATRQYGSYRAVRDNSDFIPPTPSRILDLARLDERCVGALMMHFVLETILRWKRKCSARPTAGLLPLSLPANAKRQTNGPALHAQWEIRSATSWAPRRPHRTGS